jgi:signal transduction histidine kinase
VPPVRPWSPRWLFDARLALPPLVIGLFGTAGAAHGQPDAPRDLDPLAYVLVLLAAGSVAVHRRAPWAAVAGNTVAVGLYLALGYPYGPVLLSTLFLAFGLALGLPRRQALTALAAEVAALVLATVVRLAGPGDGDGWWRLAGTWLVWLVVLAAVVALGATARVRRESAAGVREAQARRAVSEEQLRMAQELHDVVGHGLAVIAMQAGVALHVLDKEPEKVRESLLAIRAMSRESLDGLRSELAVLRAGTAGAAERRPVPGLADLGVLVDRIRAGGIDVRLVVTGDEQDVPTEVGAAAYRIVQESLTNVLRHAQTDEARVRVAVSERELVVTVEDSGRGAAADVEGSGIRGMRERAAALGGALEAQPAPRGGFAVRAVLPLVRAGVGGRG